MKCPTCQADMLVFGCRVSELPFHWCPNCGTLNTCDRDAPFVVPVLIQPRLTEPPRLSPIALVDKLPEAETEAERECIIEPHPYERISEAHGGPCRHCGLSGDHHIHNRR
jgi:hypothetical protein